MMIIIIIIIIIITHEKGGRSRKEKANYDLSETTKADYKKADY